MAQKTTGSETTSAKELEMGAGLDESDLADTDHDDEAANDLKESLLELYNSSEEIDSTAAGAGVEGLLRRDDADEFTVWIDARRLGE